MNITIACVGKIKEKYFIDAVNEYKKRLSRFSKIEIIEIPDEKIPEKCSEKQEQQIKEKESTTLLSRIKSDSYKIVLCIEGKTLSSEVLAQKIADISMHNSHITFIIGGSLGLSDNIKSIADLKLSFSPMTFPHQLMRVVLFEQVYRAFKINANESYHK